MQSDLLNRVTEHVKGANSENTVTGIALGVVVHGLIRQRHAETNDQFTDYLEGHLEFFESMTREHPDLTAYRDLVQILAVLISALNPGDVNQNL